MRLCPRESVRGLFPNTHGDRPRGLRERVGGGGEVSLGIEDPVPFRSHHPEVVTALDFRGQGRGNREAVEDGKLALVIFKDADHLTQEWTSREGDQEHAGRFEFTRQR